MRCKAAPEHLSLAGMVQGCLLESKISLIDVKKIIYFGIKVNAGVFMDADLISFESLLTSKEAASATWWAMVFTAVAAISSLVTVLVAIYAAHLAKKELVSWKEQEKQLQLVRLKRAVFAYRQGIEGAIYLLPDRKKLNEEFRSKIQPLLSDIFQELVLAGLDYEDCVQTKLFEELVQSHNRHRTEEVELQVVFSKVMELQKSIKFHL